MPSQINKQSTTRSTVPRPQGPCDRHSLFSFRFEQQRTSDLPRNLTMNGAKEASAEPCQHKHRPNAGKFGDLKGKIKPHVHAPGVCKSEPDEAKTRRLLFDAVKKGDVEQVKQLLSESSAFVNPDTVDSYVRVLQTKNLIQSLFYQLG